LGLERFPEFGLDSADGQGVPADHVVRLGEERASTILSIYHLIHNMAILCKALVICFSFRISEMKIKIRDFEVCSYYGCGHI